MKEKKVVLITGTSSGIGKATANLLNKKEFVVYGASRRIDKMEELQKNGIHILKLDLTLEEFIKQFNRNDQKHGTRPGEWQK